MQCLTVGGFSLKQVQGQAESNCLATAGGKGLQ